MTTDEVVTVEYLCGTEDFTISVSELESELAEWYLNGNFTDIRDYTSEELLKLRYDDGVSYECARVLDAAIKRASVRDN